MGDLHCPYCESYCSNHVDDCHEQDTQYEYECPECEMTFVFTIDYDPQFSSHKADCLNGSEHVYEPMVGFPKELFENKLRCRDCEKVITQKEGSRK